MEQTDCFSRCSEIPDLGPGNQECTLRCIPAGAGRTVEWGRLIWPESAENSGKQRKTAVFSGISCFILFKGLKGGKSNGERLSRRRRERGQRCRLGTPESAGNRRKSGKQRRTAVFPLFPARSGGPTRRFCPLVTESHQKVTFLSESSSSF